MLENVEHLLKNNNNNISNKQEHRTLWDAWQRIKTNYKSKKGYNSKKNTFWIVSRDSVDLSKFGADWFIFVHARGWTKSYLAILLIQGQITPLR